MDDISDLAILKERIAEYKRIIEGILTNVESNPIIRGEDLPDINISPIMSEFIKTYVDELDVNMNTSILNMLVNGKYKNNLLDLTSSFIKYDRDNVNVIINNELDILNSYDDITSYDNKPLNGTDYTLDRKYLISFKGVIVNLVNSKYVLSINGTRVHYREVAIIDNSDISVLPIDHAISTMVVSRYVSTIKEFIHKDRVIRVKSVARDTLGYHGNMFDIDYHYSSKQGRKERYYSMVTRDHSEGIRSAYPTVYNGDIDAFIINKKDTPMSRYGVLETTFRGI